MKVFFQLLKEFWLPFLISVSWTVYSTWGIKFDFVKSVSTLGPAFFFGELGCGSSVQGQEAGRGRK